MLDTLHQILHWNIIQSDPAHGHLDFKTVRISNKSSGTGLKTESETGERRQNFFHSPHRPNGRVKLARFANLTVTL